MPTRSRGHSAGAKSGMRNPFLPSMAVRGAGLEQDPLGQLWAQRLRHSPQGPRQDNHLSDQNRPHAGIEMLANGPGPKCAEIWATAMSNPPLTPSTLRAAAVYDHSGAAS